MMGYMIRNLIFSCLKLDKLVSVPPNSYSKIRKLMNNGFRGTVFSDKAICM